MNLDLSGKNALVCGSTQGLGLASAIELASLGAEVTLMARNEIKLKETVKQLSNAKGQKHKYLVADFQIPQLVKNAITDYFSSNIPYIY